MPRTLLPLALVFLAPAALAGEPNDAQVGFDAGAEGWSLNGWSTVTPTGGNPAERLHWDDFIDNFGMSARNSTHAAFLGDYTAKGEVTLSIDFQVDYIKFGPTPVSRELVVILYDDDSFMGAPPAAVWSSLGVLNGNGMGWTTFSAEVTDVLSDTLPAGWNGAGDEDPQTFEPILPAGRTWSNVLAGVDRIEFTTYVPGFFFGFTFFNLSIDNASITPLLPNAWSDQGFALAGVSGDPALAGEGTMAPGSANQLTLTNAAPSAPALVVAGFSSVPLPFKGGTLVPDVQLLVNLATGPTGSIPLAFHMPASGVPSGFEIWVQIAIQDGAAINGVALSNAVVGVTP
ncbi:MAG: hypothetical protein ACYTG2_14050 [Planctomycetota bacterium]